MKTYKHKLYLIERTKLLEGSYCQSITFTNPLGNNSLDNKAPALSYFDSPEVEGLDVYINNVYLTPYQNLDNFEILSPHDIGMLLHEADKAYYPTDLPPAKFTMCYAEIYENGNFIKELSKDENYIFTSSNAYNITVKYHIYMQGTGYNDYAVDATYLMVKSQNTYPLARWTITDVINRILQLAEPISAPDQARYTLNPIQAEKYSKMFAPEFTMTQCTLREQLKVVGGYIHAEPRLGGYHDGEYHENMIFFDEYGSTEPSEIAQAPYVYKGYAQSINQYCTDVQTNASNIVNSLNYAQGVIIDPDINGDRTLRTENVNVKLSESTSKVYTQLPIYKIEKVMCGVYNTDATYFIEPTDITAYIYEAYEYNSILSSYESNYPYTKSYGIYYTQGKNGLDGLFFKNENALGQYFSEWSIVNILATVSGKKTSEVKDHITNNFPLITFRISYLPIYEAKFSHNKQLIIKGNKKFSQIYNQSENLIETSYYGQNIKGVAQRLGNVEQSRTYILKDINQIPKVKQCIDDYSISAVNTEIQWGYIKCTVALSKAFNRLSQFVGINSNKRIAEVSERQAYKRDILLKDYIVVGDKETHNANYFVESKTNFALDVFKTNVEKNQISAVIGQGIAKKGTALNQIRLPVVSSAFGNSMLFSWNYKDNYSAGEQVGFADQKGGAFWQTDVPYCDYYGRIWYYMFDLYNNLPFDKDKHQALTPLQKGDAPENEAVFGNANDFYLVRKDSREILSFNYEIEFVTNRPDLIIGSAMASNNPLVSGIGAKLSTAPKVYFFEEPVNKFENKIDLSKAKHYEADITINNDNISFQAPDLIASAMSVKSWAIVTPIENIGTKMYQNEDGQIITETETKGGELLLASNSSGYEPNQKITIYFTGKSNIYE